MTTPKTKIELMIFDESKIGDTAYIVNFAKEANEAPDLSEDEEDYDMYEFCFANMGESSKLSKNGYMFQYVTSEGGDGDGSSLSHVYALVKDFDGTRVELHNIKVPPDAICFVEYSGWHSSYESDQLDNVRIVAPAPKMIIDFV